jgi:hypothetical protein
LLLAFDLPIGLNNGVYRAIRMWHNIALHIPLQTHRPIPRMSNRPAPPKQPGGIA